MQATALITIGRVRKVNDLFWSEERPKLVRIIEAIVHVHS
jgi:hypothetical protein